MATKYLMDRAVYDGRSPATAESFHPLLSAKRDAKDLACLYLYTLIYTVHTHTYTYMQYMHCVAFDVNLL